MVSRKFVGVIGRFAIWLKEASKSGSFKAGFTASYASAQTIATPVSLMRPKIRPNPLCP
jgi:hypothetical protein